MSGQRLRRRRRHAVALLGLLTLVASTTAVATAGAQAATTTDPLASVTYQQDPAHDGAYSDASFAAPLRRSWSVDLGGTVGYPVVAHGRVFVTVAHTTGYGDDLEARSLSTGKVLWGPKSIGGTYWTGMLAYDAGRVFTVNHDGQMAAFDAATGAQAWITQLPGQYSFTSPPTAVGGTVYVGGAGSGGTLYAVDEATGHVTWTASVMNGDNSSPVVGDGGVFVSYACEQTYRFGLDGSPAWHHDTSCEGGGGRTAVLHGGHLYVRDDAGMGPVVLDASTGDLVGTFTSDRTPAFAGTSMATESGGALAVWDTVSGDRLWQAPTTDNVTAPLVANGYVVEGRADGTVELRSLQDGSLAWSGSAGSTILPADEHNAQKLVGLAVGDGALVVPAGTRVTVFTPTTAPWVRITSGPARHQVVGPRVRFAFESNVSHPAYTCTLDGRATSCTSPVRYPRLREGRHRFRVALSGTGIRSGTRDFRVDATPPVVRLAPFSPLVTHRAHVTARWSATDSSGVRAYQVRSRQMLRGDPPPAWTPHPRTHRTSARLGVRPRHRLCVEVRAQDRVGNWSRWSTPQCVVRRG